jgi:hypothetical protein
VLDTVILVRLKPVLYWYQLLNIPHQYWYQGFFVFFFPIPGRYWYQAHFKNCHTSWVLVLGPRLIFAWYMAGMNLVLGTYKRGINLVYLRFHTRLVCSFILVLIPVLYTQVAACVLVQHWFKLSHKYFIKSFCKVINC